MPHSPPVAGSPGALTAATAVAAFGLLPVGFVVAMAVAAGSADIATLLFRARVGELLGNTLLLEALAVPACVVVAVALAWLTERTDLPGARTVAWLCVAPLAVPAFVHGYAWTGFAPRLHGLPAALLVSTLAYFPFVFLPVAAQLRGLDPAIEEAAGALGLAPRALFPRVVLPQLRLSICGGGLLVGLHLLGEYGLFALLRFDTFSTAIVDHFQSSFSGPAASMLSGVLVLCCVAMLGGERLLRGRASYARVGAGAAGRPVRHGLGRWRVPALAVALGVACLSLGVPALSLGRWLVEGGRDAWAIGPLASAGWRTAVLALAGGALAALAAAPMAWLSVRSPSRAQGLLESCHYYVGAVPGAVVGLALVTVTVSFALPLYQSYATLLAGYAMLFLPRALVGLRGSIAQAPVALEEAAVALGRSPRRAVWEVTARLAVPGVAASIALAGLGVVNELTVTLMLAPNGVTTLATRFWSLTGEIDYRGAAPYAALMVLLSLPMTVLLFRRAGPAAVAR